MTALKMKQTTFHVVQVVEYSDFFACEPAIDICSTLKLYSRNVLVRMAAILSHHFGNLSVPNDDHTLFSPSSKKHIPYLNKLFNAYYKRKNISQGQKVLILTYRTSLELWRQIFAIPSNEFTNEIEEADMEFLLFKVILSINEKIMSFKEEKDLYKLDELIFLNNFLNNDSNEYDFKAIIQPQIYYFRKLVDFIPSNEVLTKATERLFLKWGIERWQQYYTTIISLAYQTDQYIIKKENGLPVISHEWLRLNQESGIISPSLVDNLYIDEDAYLPHKVDNVADFELNIDYRCFRSKPFVKLKDGSGYVVINNQLLCERLFNSLYFDFAPLIKGKKDDCGFFDYNRNFVEKVLFRSTFFNCITPSCYTFPTKKSSDVIEKNHEPDFYVRTKHGELIILECKAIKMNGECRDDGDYVRFLDELHEKIVLKTRNLDKNRKVYKGEEPIGIGQLIHHIDSIEDDSFEWDNDIPNDVIYYPILVFEDTKLAQKGILSIVNRWFYEELEKEQWHDLVNKAIMPIMVLSINTLYLYDDLLRRRGFTNVIDSFVSENAIFDETTGKYNISAVADFDEYLRSNPYHKGGEVVRWFKKMIQNSQ